MRVIIDLQILQVEDMIWVAAAGHREVSIEDRNG
jgi:hypothetical protein